MLLLIEDDKQQEAVYDLSVLFGGGEHINFFPKLKRREAETQNTEVQMKYSGITICNISYYACTTLSVLVFYFVFCIIFFVFSSYNLHNLTRL